MTRLMVAAPQCSIDRDQISPPGAEITMGNAKIAQDQCQLFAAAAFSRSRRNHLAAQGSSTAPDEGL
jgi:hypothetical protein